MDRIARAVERCARSLGMVMIALGLVGLAQQGIEGMEHLAICLGVAAAAWLTGYGMRSLRAAVPLVRPVGADERADG